MASQGPNSGGTFANETSIGTQAWTSPSNAASSNNSYVTATSSGTGEWLTNYIKATNFGFSIPGGATIDGIIVEVERKALTNNGTQFIVDNSVKLVKGGTISGSEKADTSTKWLTSDTYKTYGSSTDLWGLTWTDSDINSSTFGVVFSADIEKQFKFHETASVDHVRITVHYTTGGGPAASALLTVSD